MDTACSVDTWEGDEDSVFIGNRGSTHLRDYASKDGHGYNLVVLGAWHYLTGELLRRGRDKDHMLFVLKTIGQIHPPPDSILAPRSVVLRHQEAERRHGLRRNACWRSCENSERERRQL